MYKCFNFYNFFITYCLRFFFKVFDYYNLKVLQLGKGSLITFNIFAMIFLSSYDFDCGIAEEGTWLAVYKYYYDLSSLFIFTTILIGTLLIFNFFYFRIKVELVRSTQYSEIATSGIDFLFSLRFNLDLHAFTFNSYYYLLPISNYFYVSTLKFIYKYVTPLNHMFLSTVYHNMVSNALKRSIQVLAFILHFTSIHLIYFFGSKLLGFSKYRSTGYYLEVLHAVLLTIFCISIITPSILFTYLIVVNSDTFLLRYNLHFLGKSYTVYAHNFYKLNSFITRSKTLDVVVEANQWFWSYKIEADSAKAYITYLNYFQFADFNYFSTFSFLRKLNYCYYGDIFYSSSMIRVENIDFGIEGSLHFKPQRLLSVDIPLFLPMETLVTFYILSNDVIHSFSLPQFLIKADAIPGKITAVKFDTKMHTGIFYGQCSEICGINHAFMPVSICIL